MEFDRSRLRRGELIAAAGAVVLLVAIFLLPWYGIKGTLAEPLAKLGVSTSVDGWHALSTLRWLMIVTVAAALALAYLQATRRSPALPATFSLLVTLLGGLTALALIYRVLINVPGPNSVVDRDAGAFVGLLSACVIAYGGYKSLREEGVAPRDERTEIPTIDLDSARADTPS
jgi:hypothetical protein